MFSLHAVARHFVEPQAGMVEMDSAMVDALSQEAGVSAAPEAVLSADNGNEESFVGLNDSDTIWNPLTKSWLTAEQVGLLKLAFDIGYRHGGAQHARLMQATLMQETIAGLLGRIGHMSAPVGKRSYGVMQVKVSAARDVLRLHPELGRFRSDEELIAHLITDDSFNIRMASLFMMHLRNQTDNDAEALTAYNIGLRASRKHKDHSDFKYVKGVRRFYERVVVPFNRKFNLFEDLSSEA